ncbi:MAG: GNAT family N-acetyltransferase [Actinomycetota bacterium]
MKVTVYDELGAIDALADSWRALAARDPTATIFQTPEYAHTWWEEFGALRSLALVGMTGEDGALCGLAPLSMEPDGGVHFVGDPAITDYLAPVSAAADRDVVAATLVEVAAGLDGFGRLSLSGLPGDSGWPEAIARAAKAAGMDVAEEPDDVCPVAPTGESWEAYLAALPGKQRHEIRRKARRLEAVGAFRVRVATDESLDADLESFFALHRSSTGPKGKFMHENMAVYFRRLAHTLQSRGEMRLTVMYVGDEPVAALYGFSDGRTWSVYNSSYDHARRELSPGLVLVAEAIRLACDEGCASFDFLRGAEEYKYRFGAVDRAVIRVTATP